MGLLGGDDDDGNSNKKRGGFPEGEELSMPTQNFKRVIDEEAGVVLYGVGSNSAYGLAAVPIEDTDLEID